MTSAGCSSVRAWARLLLWAGPVQRKVLSSRSLFHQRARASPRVAEEREEGLTPSPALLTTEAIQDPEPLLPEEILRLLSSQDLAVERLCHLGEVALTLPGGRSEVLARVLARVSAALEQTRVSPREAERVYAFTARCFQAGNQQQRLLLAALDSQTRSLVYRLRPGQVSSILQALLRQRERQVTPLVHKLSRRAAWNLKSFSDSDLRKVLSVLMDLGQHDQVLLDALEYHLPGRLRDSDPELISAVMQFCMQTRCRSEPILEAVAQNFVRSADTHSSEQVAAQVAAMGRLNYLPQCSGQMFGKLESILSSRSSHFQPASLIQVLHACIHLQRFPLNHLAKVFSPYFLQRVTGAALDRTALAQLTQLHLSAALECTGYWGPRLPPALHTRSFSSVDEALETPLDVMLYRQVRAPLTELLGGRCFLAERLTPCGYTIDVELCLDERGYVLPRSQWQQAHRRVALCLDGEKHFCSNTLHLLGKEATKRRHLRRTGYEVVQIPYTEVERLRRPEERVQYLHSKIFPTINKFRR
ncbi:FAST kinase domain-containing protein 3, mitochondrial-like [Synchiropus splendidus]|uniref:FAST kinase domain-containing protein 3, mitochondrial-like n=1 Tax=Synchiropus splendidus TaxID=270530 RepID=UPI00237D668A|nr:FAST kinase domain-containing protein 3, mitochondrial-like [Synchiropus splendidus]